HQQPLLVADPCGEPLRAELQEELARARWGRHVRIMARHQRLSTGAFLGGSIHSRRQPAAPGGQRRVAVDGDLADELQQAGGAVAARREVEELRGFVDEGGGGASLLEEWMPEDV